MIILSLFVRQCCHVACDPVNYSGFTFGSDVLSILYTADTHTIHY